MFVRELKLFSEAALISLHRVWPSWILHQNFSGLQINDISFLLSFDYGEIGIFLELLYCRWPEDQKTGSPLMPIEGFYFFCQLPYKLR